MDRLASITAFVRVAENGGFSAAARHLNVSTTTVSDQVQALENTLGVRLSNRTTRRVSLTEIGRGYYERCSQILQELAEADEAASALQVTPRGRLRVYCQQGLSRLVAVVTIHFLRDYPEVSMDLLSGDTMIDLVQEGFDLAIMPTLPPDSTLVKRTLSKWNFVTCGAPAYLESHGAPRTPADLAVTIFCGTLLRPLAPSSILPIAPGTRCPSASRATSSAPVSSSCAPPPLPGSDCGCAHLSSFPIFSLPGSWCRCCPNTAHRKWRSSRSTRIAGS